ncbi:hypothetical protein Barb6_00903 [Bacteroidales bacterium Barb6]|nr:hypothetical protein Barb6_03180 [Bacteroidales bacterium Barb6]OAV72705.1 hypothetical protein Barb6_00903 [Bacteroidales bacterium Barb6]
MIFRRIARYGVVLSRCAYLQWACKGRGFKQPAAVGVSFRFGQAVGNAPRHPSGFPVHAAHGIRHIGQQFPCFGFTGPYFGFTEPRRHGGDCRESCRVVEGVHNRYLIAFERLRLQDFAAGIVEFGGSLRLQPDKEVVEADFVQSKQGKGTGYCFVFRENVIKQQATVRIKEQAFAG